MNERTLWINIDGEGICWLADETEAAPLLRKSFDLDRVPDNAFIRFAAPGWAEITVNGKPVSDDVLVPAVTQLDKHTGICEYDVSSLLKTGKNVIAAELGNGWYNASTKQNWHFDKATWRNYPRLFLELYADNGKIIQTDRSWKGTHGAIISSQLRCGEIFDANRVIKNWNTPDFDDSNWKDVIIVAPPAGDLIRETAPQCRIIKEIPVKSINKIAENTFVYDFGQNLTGVCRFTFSGKAGAKATMLYSELLAEDGDVNRSNIDCYIHSGDVAQKDTYIHGENDPFVWQPKFVYHGFRYLKVVIEGELTISEISACYIASGFEPNGEMTISNPTAAGVQACTINSFLGNFTGIPTDCPHREKNGWTGDAQLACQTGLWAFDSAENYLHFARILADAQRPSGQLPGIAPCAGWGFNWGNGPVWDAALFEIPYQVWKFTGNINAVKEFYPHMKSYVEFCLNTQSGNIIDFGLGDWCHWSQKRIVDIKVTSTAYFYYILNITEEISRFAFPGDTAYLNRVKNDVKTAFIKNFRNADGTYAKDEWTANACAIFFGFDDSEKLVKHLVKQVRDNEHKADFGIVGAKIIPRVLANYGYAQDAFKLYTQTQFPGWGNWIEKGATTLWENWNGSGSQFHIMYGDFTAWSFEYIAGIKLLAPGFSKIILAPADIPETGNFKFSYRTPFGKIVVEKIENLCRYHIPEGIDAEVKFPDNWEVEAF
ncbi:MAG: family 78 glycoside hydrolase catalytic domain [Lentisphaeria bacterium]|nr:family 78 glycoside hydrolase catalytic domain [Lentisphaeria bacterium]